MALTKGKKGQKFAGGGILNVPVTAGAVCFGGGLAMLSSGNAIPARVGQGGSDMAKVADVALSRVVGVFCRSVTGGATDGAETVDIEDGTWLFKNSAGVDALTSANVDQYCFVIDDETVAKLSAAGTRPIAGIVREVTSAGVWVELSAVASAAARRTIILPFAINETDTLAPTNAEFVSPVAGRISRLTTVVQKAVTTGGDVTVLVDTTTVVGLACTIPDAAAKGSIITDTPTLGDATTIVAAGQRIQVAPAAAFATAGAVSGFVEITY
jgi:hypothetical protein